MAYPLPLWAILMIAVTWYFVDLCLEAHYLFASFTVGHCVGSYRAAHLELTVSCRKEKICIIHLSMAGRNVHVLYYAFSVLICSLVVELIPGKMMMWSFVTIFPSTDPRLSFYMSRSWIPFFHNSDISVTGLFIKCAILKWRKQCQVSAK